MAGVLCPATLEHHRSESCFVSTMNRSTSGGGIETNMNGKCTTYLLQDQFIGLWIGITKRRFRFFQKSYAASYAAQRTGLEPNANKASCSGKAAANFMVVRAPVREPRKARRNRQRTDSNRRQRHEPHELLRKVYFRREWKVYAHATKNDRIDVALARSLLGNVKFLAAMLA